MGKFTLAVKREVLIYLTMLFILSLVMHSELLSNPLLRFQMMQNKANYFHPFLYTFLIYSILFIFRTILDFILGLFEKKVN